MFYKTKSVFLIFLFSFFFGNILLINNKGRINIFKSLYGSRYVFDAKFITIPSCILGLREFVRCKALEMTFVNEKKIFAEILLRYDDNSSTSHSKTKINLIITFEKENIILSHGNRHVYCSYDKNGINTLQTSIKNIDYNIHFKVVKIYNSNLPISGNLVNDTVYDEKTINQLKKIANLFLWKYAKEDLVKVLYPSVHYVTLQNFINNSTTYQCTIEKTLTGAIETMNYRTARYACLLVVYAYETLYINESQKEYWEKVIKLLNVLSEAQEYLKAHDERSLLFINISYALNQINPDSYDKLFKLNFLVEKFVTQILTSKDINKEDLKETKHSKSYETNTHKLPVDILIKLFQGFPKPLKKHFFAYNFDVIPFSLDKIHQKLFTIVELIETEYEIFLEENK
ncbi:uncharacterized protein LOC126906971 [Daktulosphaira vitifoliae]|uniref:uncharacterized protein LOC126906971 n=1 Tax=Daktulosphaira vitifoliae TaxID=58002 RepID=UPI0021AAF947|nr:uncharacterized protein LOC126906971 [Daktulosphaira vitifoliae]